MSRPSPWLQALPRAVVLLDTDGRVVESNEAARQLFGATLDASFEGGAFQRGGLDEVRRQVVAGARWRGELVVPTDEGDRRLHVDLAPVPPGGPAVLILLAEPVGSDDRAGRVSERLTRLVQVAAELQAVEGMDSLTDVVVSHLADAAGATAASFSVLVRPGTLAMVALRGGPPGAADRWATYPADETTPAGAALVNRRPLLVSGRAELERRYPEITLSATGERSLLCLPLLVRSQGIGVVTLSFPSQVDLDDELEFFRTMADVCAQALARVRAQQTVDAQRARLEFLARASEELAGSLDTEATLALAARLAVPAHADWATVCLEQEGRLRTVAVTHREPDKAALVRRFADCFLTDPSAATNAYAVLRTGESRLVTDLDPRLRDTVTDPCQRALLDELPFDSALVVPLVARDRVIGTLGWARNDPVRRYTAVDLAVAKDVARRAGVAIDNASLHGELRDVAERLQSVVEPPTLPSTPGWRLASSYRSAGQGTVGGDFYDAVPLHDGRLALVIGDVMGRGVEAAAAMTQLRSVVRAFLAVDPEPRVVLDRLDTYYERFPSDQLVTLIYAIADPRCDEVVVVSAGHPPPLVVRADGTVTFLEAATGTILGVQRTGRPRVTATLHPGDTLLLFTDGLIERRDEDLGESKERLRRLCEGLRLHADPVMLAQLVEGMRDTTRDDDVAVLAATRVTG